MKPLHFLLYGLVLLSLTACPFLDVPEPLAPLAKPKTQKTSFKANGCRLKTYYSDASNAYTYQYDAEGKLLNERHSSGSFGYDYEYDVNGFLTNRYVYYGEGYTFPDQQYEYNPDGTVKPLPDAYGANASRDYDSAGRLVKITGETGGTPFTVSYKYNAAGNLIETARQGKFCDGAKVCTSLVRYDDNGNEIFSEGKSDEFGSSTVETTYDTHPNPKNLLPVFKGWPATRPLNNVVRRVYKSDGFTRNGIVFPAQTITDVYEYTYNAQGYPVQVKNTYTSSAPGQDRVTQYANEYTGCP